MRANACTRQCSSPRPLKVCKQHSCIYCTATKQCLQKPGQGAPTGLIVPPVPAGGMRETSTDGLKTARKQNRLKEHLVILHICYLQFQVQQRALTFTCWSSLQCQEFGRKIEHTCFLFACRHLTRTLIDEKYGSCKLSKGLLFKAQPFLSSMKKTSMQIYPLVQ